ncbi:response regulator transcription factor [Ihubacter sp. rT4E-8]|uniref:response regulator transcription factor n=1 Tax=unclassified Ihubacter TaxID=2633299 RepID=UPI00137A4086
MAQKILVVDDENMMTTLLESHLRGSGYLVWVAENAEKAVERLSVQPDLILLDINMPGTNGLELCRRIRNQVSCPILFLTARVEETDKVDGFRAGGDDYITKPFSLRELTARIEAHLRREQRERFETAILTSHGFIMNLSERTVSWKAEEIQLSKREFDIMRFLIEHPRQVFSRERIYEAVWGFDSEGDDSVIKEHVRKIRVKLQAAAGKDYEDYIETIWGIGYRWNG